MPRERFSHSATTPATRSRVWEALQAPDTWEGIGGVDKVQDAVIDSEGQLGGFTFLTRVAGRSYVGEATPHSREEQREMAWNIKNSEVRGVISIELSDHDHGTEITVDLDVEAAGLLSSMFFPVIAKTIGSGLPRTVDEFATSFDDHP